jgi:hypothetical protein
MNKLITGSVAVAVAGSSMLVACTPSAPKPVPAYGCYTGDSRADLKVVGKVGTLNALEVYDPGSHCATNLTVTFAAVPFVKATGAAGVSGAISQCLPIDAATVNGVDLSTWTTPAPGLAGYWACSPK